MGTSSLTPHLSRYTWGGLCACEEGGVGRNTLTILKSLHVVRKGSRSRAPCRGTRPGRSSAPSPYKVELPECLAEHRRSTLTDSLLALLCPPSQINSADSDRKSNAAYDCGGYSGLRAGERESRRAALNAAAHSPLRGFHSLLPQPIQQPAVACHSGPVPEPCLQPFIAPSSPPVLLTLHLSSLPAGIHLSLGWWAVALEVGLRELTQPGVGGMAG